MEIHTPNSRPDGRVICTCGDWNCASLTQIPLVKLSETEFAEEYKLLNAPSGEPLWMREEVRAMETPTNRVWTVVETGDPDDENWYALPGYRIVNKIDYVVTAFPWPHENIEAVYFEDDFNHAND